VRRFLIAGNWKMNTTRATAEALARAVAARVPAGGLAVDVMIAPPFPYLIPVASALTGSGVTLGAQNAYHEPPGAFTGEVAVAMLKDAGCRYVILGHSERRHVLGETDEFINRKVRAVLAGGLEPVLCVGELLEERNAGRTEEVLDRQLSGGLEGIAADAAERVVIAYEPVWAIGTGVNATPGQAESAHSHLRRRLSERYNSALAGRLRILYGGSVKPDNAEALLGQTNVDGALVGGASLKPEAFLPIVDAAVRLAAD
jgi:triosephosphate isomerase (TIM)